MKEKIVFLLLIGVLVVTSLALISRLPKVDLPNLNSIFEAIETELVSGTIDAPTPTEANTNTFNTIINIPTQSLIPTKRAATPTAKPCYKYPVNHSDGTTSNLCYSQSDYSQLVNLSFELSSAQTFYKFHLDGVADYQAEYERTGSSVYLNAKASSQAKADEQKAIIDSTNAKMYNIEQRGY